MIWLILMIVGIVLILLGMFVFRNDSLSMWCAVIGVSLFLIGFWLTVLGIGR